ncbi:MAG: hypothetical protein WKF87_09980 [Chryseolinea sp.]
MEAIKEWFFGLGARYNVNPIVFGAIYVGAIPFFLLSLWWIVRNYKQKKSLIFPILSASIFFVSAYLYLIVVGKNIPIWVYCFIVAVLIYGIFATIKKVKSRIR